jgi:hypothetical protein
MTDRKKADVVGDILANMANMADTEHADELSRSEHANSNTVIAITDQERPRVGLSANGRLQTLTAADRGKVPIARSSGTRKPVSRGVAAVTDVHDRRAHDISDESESDNEESFATFKTYMKSQLRQIKEAVFDGNASDWPDAQGFDASDGMAAHEGLPEEGEIFDTEPPGKRQKLSDDFLDSVLQEIGNEAPCGPPICDKLANIITAIGNQGINDAARSEKIKTMARPANCPLLSVARVNSEMWDVVRGDTRTRDVKFQRVSQSLVAGIVPVVQLANTMIESVNTSGNLPSRTVMIKQLTSAITLLMESKHDLDMRRRDFIRPDLQNDFRALCNQKNAVTDLLFGDELPKNIRDISELNRVTSRVQLRGATQFRGRARGSGFTRRAFRGRFLGRTYQRRGAFRQTASRGKATFQK